MSKALHKNFIIKKTIEVGSSTLLSRFFGIIREGLSVVYLGAGVWSDAFFTAFKIPNSLRKIFAEGALSAAFIPTLVHVVRQRDKEQANSLMSLAFVVFEGLVLLLCALVMCKADTVVSLIAPGFSQEKVALAVPLLRILMPFIFFLSSSALLAGALQSVGHFFVPAFSPVMLNIVFITGLIICWSFNLPVAYLCFFILCGGFIQFLGHFIAYRNEGFAFGAINAGAWRNIGGVVSKFLLGSISMSILEINLFIDTTFASYLPEGSISLIYYANRFMGIPLGVFAVAFSTILLPYFSRISAYAPKRLSFFLLETTKFVVWVTLPATLIMSFLAEKIFHTIFLSEKFTMAHVVQAGHILVAFLLGLCFFSLNKILLNMYYALHVAWVPAVISALATLANIILNYYLMDYLQATGLALATTISGIVQTACFAFFLWRYFGFRLYGYAFINFLGRYIAQLTLILTGTYACYCGFEVAITSLTSGALKQTLLYGLGFWVWVGPLCIMASALIFYTRKLFNITLYYLD